MNNLPFDLNDILRRYGGGGGGQQAIVFGSGSTVTQTTVTRNGITQTSVSTTTTNPSRIVQSNDGRSVSVFEIDDNGEDKSMQSSVVETNVSGQTYANVPEMEFHGTVTNCTFKNIGSLVFRDAVVDCSITNAASIKGRSFKSTVFKNCLKITGSTFKDGSATNGPATNGGYIEGDSFVHFRIQNFREVVINENDTTTTTSSGTKRTKSIEAGIMGCSFCQDARKPLSACGGCKTEFYCSESCADKDWVSGHAESCNNRKNK